MVAQFADQLRPDRRLFDSPLSRAPVFLLLLFCCSDLFLVQDIGVPSRLAFLSALLFSVGWGLLGTERPNPGSLPLVVLLLAFTPLLLLRFQIAFAPQALPVVLNEEPGVVIDERAWGYRRTAFVRTAVGRYVLESGSENTRPGDEVLVSGDVEPFARASVPGAFDEQRYWRAKGGDARIVEAEMHVTGVRRTVPYWRQRLSERVLATLPARTAGYLLASWTGVRDTALESLHRSAGTSHLLAVSGFHVGIVFGLLWCLLRRVRFRLIWISAAIWGYALLTGAAPSALRAAFMIQVVIGGRLAGRAGNSFNCVACAGVLLLAWNPWLFWDIGWRLSMSAALTITGLSALCRSNRLKAFLLCPAVWVTTAAQSASVFGSAPLAGLIMNLIAMPVFSFLLPAASLLALPALLGLPGGRFFAAFSEGAFFLWEGFSSNVLYLLPWSVGYSPLLGLSGTSLALFLFAIASGYSQERALLAAGMVGLGLTSLAFLM